MPWDPFLMKKLLKSGICGSMNSAWVYCSRLTWSNSAVGKQKKKKKGQKTQTQPLIIRIQTHAKNIKIITTNPYFTVWLLEKYPNNNSNQIKIITSTRLIQMQKPIKKNKIKLSEQT